MFLWSQYFPQVSAYPTSYNPALENEERPQLLVVLADTGDLALVLGATTFLILARSCYRAAELSGGFAGHLAQDQVAFMVLDGALILSASILLTVQNPGWVFGRAWADTAYKWGPSKKNHDNHEALELGSIASDERGTATFEEQANKNPMVV